MVVVVVRSRKCYRGGNGAMGKIRDSSGVDGR